MNIGRMRHRITIKSANTTIDSAGYTIESPINFAVVWADVQPISGKEYFGAAAIKAEKLVRFKIRYIQGITNDMTVEFEGKTYSVKSIIDTDMRHKELILVCEVIQNG